MTCEGCGPMKTAAGSRAIQQQIAEKNKPMKQTKSESQTGLITSGEAKLMRPARVAKMLYPAVREELRGNNEPVFISIDALERNLCYAFSKGLITGQKKSNRELWMNWQSALDYVTAYCTAAKTSKAKVYMPRIKPAHVSIQVVDGNNHPHDEQQFILEKDGHLVAIVKNSAGDDLYPNASSAAIAELYGLGYKLRRIGKEVK